MNNINTPEQGYDALHAKFITEVDWLQARLEACSELIAILDLDNKHDRILCEELHAFINNETCKLGSALSDTLPKNIPLGNKDKKGTNQKELSI